MTSKASAILFAVASYCIFHAEAANSQTVAPSATQYYESALSAMNSMPEPAYVRYTIDIVGNGVGVGLDVRNDGSAGILLALAAGQHQKHWQADYRNADQAVRLSWGDHGHAYSHSPLFDPTWTGMHSWLKYGVQGAPAQSGPSGPSAPPTAAPSSVPSITEIAYVTAVSAGAYNVSDAGSDKCSNGDSGYKAHLSPRSDPSAHPLTDVVIDTQTRRFCSMRFALRGGSGALNTTGFVELHFGQVGNYWLVTDGLSDIEARVFGLGFRHASITFTHANLVMPASLPEAVFGH